MLREIVPIFKIIARTPYQLKIAVRRSNAENIESCEMNVQRDHKLLLEIMLIVNMRQTAIYQVRNISRD